MAALRGTDDLALAIIDSHLKPHLRKLLGSEFGDEWEAHLRGISRALRDRYFDDLTPQRAIRAVGEGTDTGEFDTASANDLALPPLVSDTLDALAKRDGAGVASSLRAWMLEKANRRSDTLAELVANPPALLEEASYLAWEAVGHFASSYDLGDPYSAYEKAVQRMSPRSTLLQVDEALRRFNGSNFAEANQFLDRLPQDDVLVKVARAVIEDDMPQVLTLLEDGMVHQSEEARIAQFGERVRIAALMQIGDLVEAIALARQAMDRYPGYSFWRTFCSHLLALAAQNEKGDGARRRHLAEEGAKLALEARDIIRRWDGPSGPSVAVALACQLLLRDPQEVCRLATLSPSGVATDAEAQHPEVIVYLARAYAMLGRIDELRELDTSGLSEFERMVIRAWMARHENDPEAISLMRAAYGLAESDVERSAAQYGLASLGGLDDLVADADLQQNPSEAALLSSLAAFEQDDLERALALIRPHVWASPVHVAQHAHILVNQGDVDTAVARLEEGAMRFSAPELLWMAAEDLIGNSRYDEAEPLVARALGHTEDVTLRKLLRGQQVDIASNQHNWRKMQQCAVAAATEFEDEAQFHWAAIYALCNEGETDRAFRYLQEHNVEAYNRQSQLVGASLRSEFDSSIDTVDWLLDLAEANTADEEAHAAFLVAIFEAGRELDLDVERLTRRDALVSRFVQAYPTSALFRVIETPDRESSDIEPDDIDAFVAEMRAILEPGSIQKAEVAEKVALGQLPFGMLCAVSKVPYALLLAECAPGALVAIAGDEDTRRRERDIATAALGGTVAVDTSSILLWQQHLDGSLSILRCFAELLVPSELLADLRAAERSLKTPTLGSIGFNPATGRLIISEANASHVRATQDAIAAILSSAGSWTHVESASLPMPDSGEVPSQLAPWDAALRVALHRDCALWIDDAAMREAARHLGIPAFGTLALYEALLGATMATELPPSLDLKRSLTRSRVADVPMTWSELDAIADQDGMIAAGFIMERPSSWSDHVVALRWTQQVLTRLRDEGHRDEAAYLLHASIVGAGRAADPDAARGIAGTLLTTALLTGFPYEVVPQLVDAARAACQKLTLDNQVDPLPVAASQLVQAANEMFPELEGNYVGGFVMGMFSHLDELSQQRVSAAILTPDRLD